MFLGNLKFDPIEFKKVASVLVVLQYKYALSTVPLPLMRKGKKTPEASESPKTTTAPESTRRGLRSICIKMLLRKEESRHITKAVSHPRLQRWYQQSKHKFLHDSNRFFD